MPLTLTLTLTLTRIGSVKAEIIASKVGVEGKSSKIAQSTSVIKKQEPQIKKAKQDVKEIKPKVPPLPKFPKTADGKPIVATKMKAPTTARKRDFDAEVKAIYQKYNPEFDQSKVEKLLSSYKGKEQSLIDKLMEKYAPGEKPPLDTTPKKTGMKAPSASGMKAPSGITKPKTGIPIPPFEDKTKIKTSPKPGKHM